MEDHFSCPGTSLHIRSTLSIGCQLSIGIRPRVMVWFPSWEIWEMFIYISLFKENKYYTITVTALCWYNNFVSDIQGHAKLSECIVGWSGSVFRYLSTSLLLWVTHFQGQDVVELRGLVKEGGTSDRSDPCTGSQILLRLHLSGYWLLLCSAKSGTTVVSFSSSGSS